MSKSGATNPRPNAHKGFYPNRLLASSGPYRDYISLVSALVPKVAVADPRNPASPLENRHANVTMLNLKENTKPYCREFSDTSSLQEHLDRRLRAAKPTPAGTPERRIYILEGLNADYIAILGGFFYMDPLFFVDQEQTSIWDKSHFGARMTECLPSVAESMSSFRLPYFEIMYFNKLIEHYQMHCKSTGRHIGITRMSGKFEKEVIVRRKCSFWSQENDDSGWDVVILTDPPVHEVMQDNQIIKMPNTPFQGGYLDFIPRTTRVTNTTPSPPRTSMRDDLVYYFNTHYAILPSLSSPKIAALFLKKITASHYMQLHHSIRSIVSSQEWNISRRGNLSSGEVGFVEGQWFDFQALNRRCTEYCEDVERILLVLDRKAESPDFPEAADWMDSNKDFQLIHARLKALKARYEVLLGSITALAGIAGNRQSLAEAKRSFREAKNVKILTLIGMVFIPLAFICGLFSMNDNFLPGSSEFWVYWASAVPLIVIVFLGSVVANWGYDDDAGTWSMTNIWRKVRETAWRKAGNTEK